MIVVNIINNIKVKLMNPTARANYYKKNNILKMGIDCEIYHNVTLGSEAYLIELGDKVRITAGVTFVNHDGGMWVIRNMELNEKAGKIDKIKIGNNVFIGINSTIMPGVVIGDNVIIGAHSVVTKSIPNNSVAAGAPAKVLCTVEEYYEKNKPYIDDIVDFSYEEKKNYYLKKLNL